MVAFNRLLRTPRNGIKNAEPVERIRDDRRRGEPLEERPPLERRGARGADLGVGAGDRVALWLPNVPAWLACFFACAQLGAIVVTVNTRFKSNEVADIVGRSGR